MTYQPQPDQQNPDGRQGQPHRSKTGRIVAGIVIAVLVLGAGGVWLLARDDGGAKNVSQESNQSSGAGPIPDDGDPGGEEAVVAVVEDYLEAINNEDGAAATELTCNRSDPGVLYQTIAGKIQVEAGPVDMSTATSALAQYTLLGGSEGAPLFVEHRDGAWCISV